MEKFRSGINVNLFIFTVMVLIISFIYLSTCQKYEYEKDGYYIIHFDNADNLSRIVVKYNEKDTTTFLILNNQPAIDELDSVVICVNDTRFKVLCEKEKPCKYFLHTGQMNKSILCADSVNAMLPEK